MKWIPSAISNSISKPPLTLSVSIPMASSPAQVFSRTAHSMASSPVSSMPPLANTQACPLWPRQWIRLRAGYRIPLPRRYQPGVLLRRNLCRILSAPILISFQNHQGCEYRPQQSGIDTHETTCSRISVNRSHFQRWRRCKQFAAPKHVVKQDQGHQVLTLITPFTTRPSRTSRQGIIRFVSILPPPISSPTPKGPCKSPCPQLRRISPNPAAA